MKFKKIKSYNSTIFGRINEDFFTELLKIVKKKYQKKKKNIKGKF